MSLRWRVGVLSLLGALVLGACDPGPPLPQVRKLRIRRLTRGVSARAWPVEIEGKGFASTTGHPLRFELWRIRPARPRVRIDLEQVRIRDQRHVQARVPAGILPGRYRLVVFRGQRWRSFPHRVWVMAPGRNRGYPAQLSLRVRDSRAGVGGRLMISGANLQRPALVTLHGPQGRAVSRSGRKRPKFKRMAIAELNGPRAVTPTRVTARLPEDLAAGRYFVRVYTSTHRGNPAEYVLTLKPTPKSAIPPLVWALALPVLLLLLAGLLAVLLGRPLRPVRPVLLVLGGAVGWALLLVLPLLIS